MTCRRRRACRSVPTGPAAALQRGAALAKRFGVPVIDSATLNRFRNEEARTSYLFDVRTPAEYARGHAERFVSAQGGQLVQALDKWAGTRGARSCSRTMTASAPR